MTAASEQDVKLCPACALALRVESSLYHIRCLGPDHCECSHDALQAVLFRGVRRSA